ncbi:MAG: right-handed parallel beta-helix repeat-containing protein [Planctomycetota bacterium]|jgi:predicted outer membrane repeat protein
MNRIILLNLALLLAVAASAPAAILVVSPDEYPTIQAAVDDAHDGDIVMLTPRTYTGPGNRDIDFRGKAITVRSVAPDNPQIVAATIIDCNGSETEPNRGFYFHSYEGPASVLEGLTITNGCAEQGGAIYCSQSSPTISNCSLTGNSADRGGGLYCTGSPPTVTDCTFTNNSANYGGGTYSEFSSNPTLTGCTFAGNTASYDGGGIFCNGEGYMASTPTITNCSFTDNSAKSGGAVFCNGPWKYRIPSSPFIENCTFTGNSAVMLCRLQQAFNQELHLRAELSAWHFLLLWRGRRNVE